MTALDINGISSVSIVEGSYNTGLFNFSFKSFFLDKVGSFSDGEDSSVVVLDNCRIHDSDEFIQMVRDRGGIVIFLPPYSPDLNPIELAFNNVKSWLKRNRSYLEQNPKLAIYDAFVALDFAHPEYYFHVWLLLVSIIKDQRSQTYYRRSLL